MQASSALVRATVSPPQPVVALSWFCLRLLWADMNIAGYAKSALYISQYHYLHGGGNLSLAREYLEQLSASNSEDINAAQELLKQAMAAIRAKEGRVKAEGTEVEDVSMES